MFNFIQSNCKKTIIIKSLQLPKKLLIIHTIKHATINKNLLLSVIIIYLYLNLSVSVITIKTALILSGYSFKLRLEISMPSFVSSSMPSSYDEKI
ncbi:hypothetical protein MOMA_07731 [Moraxella macacae 0408225]|uniref:Uncharacterized protein n=1 Tax=Moraxella macacae 0408225 TaxID=1230338 RepID=L2F5U3_9GAMM|nr:hypothetical protein MOMA_07731 [Moraxella macacae 0408225]